MATHSSTAELQLAQLEVIAQLQAVAELSDCKNTKPRLFESLA